MKRIPTDLSIEDIMLTYNKSERTAFRYKKNGIPLSVFSRYGNSHNGTDKNYKTVKLSKSTKNDNDKLTDKIDYLTDKIERLESLVNSLVLEIRNIKTTDKSTDNFAVKKEGFNKELVINTTTNNKQEIIIDTYKTKNDSVNLVNCQTVKNSNLTKSSNAKKSQSKIPAIQEMISAEEFKIFKEQVIDKYPKASIKFRLNAVVQEYMTFSHDEKQELFNDMEKVIAFNKGRKPCHIKNLLSFLKERHWQVIDKDVLSFSQSKSQINVGSELSRRLDRLRGA